LVGQRYLFARVHLGDDSRPVVIHEVSDQRCCIRGERDTWGTLQIEAWPDSGARGLPIWRASVDADAGELVDGFYRAVTFGCCDAENQYVYFDLLHGGPAFHATGLHSAMQEALSSIRDDQTRQQRFIAFRDAYAFKDIATLSRNQDIVGMLQYGPSSGATQRVVVRRAGGKGHAYWNEDLRFVVNGKIQARGDARLHAEDRIAPITPFSGFSLRLEFTTYDAPIDVIAIPVISDRLDLPSAKVAKGYSLELVPNK
jgi:hypothetical protein